MSADAEAQLRGSAPERVLLWAAGLGVAVVAPLFPHVATGLDPALADPLPSGLGLLLSRAVLAMVLCLAVLVVFQAVSARQRSQSGKQLAWAAAAFWAAPMISVLCGGRGGIQMSAFFAPLLFTALFLAPRRPFPQVLRQLRFVLRCFVWGSLLAIPLAPDWAFLTPSGGGAGRDFLGLGWGQLCGLASNPNLLGPIAAAAVLLEVTPVARRRGWAVHAAAAGAALALTQSRTAWACLVALYFVQSVRQKVMCRVAALFALVGASILLMAPSVQAALIRSTVGSEEWDYNGRSQAWQLAYAEFKRSPLFGYGPALFDSQHRIQLFGTVNHWIGQAHNQILQSLGEAGTFGGLGIALLLIALAVQATRAAATTAGLSVALTCLLIIECAMEVPLRVNGGLSPSVLLLIVVWCVLLHGNTAASASEGAPKCTIASH